MNARDSVHLTGDRKCSDAGLAMGRKELGAVPQAASVMIAATKDARSTMRPADPRCLFMMSFLPGTRLLFALEYGLRARLHWAWIARGWVAPRPSDGRFTASAMSGLLHDAPATIFL